MMKILKMALNMPNNRNMIKNRTNNNNNNQKITTNNRRMNQIMCATWLACGRPAS